MRGTRAGLGALVGLLLGGGAARAADRVAVLAVGGCAPAQAEGPARDLREALARRRGAAVLSEEATAAALGGASTGSLAGAEQLLASARADFYQEAYERAERSLRNALELLQALPPGEPRWKDTREALTQLAQLHAKQGKAPEAEADLRRILRVEPAYLPSTKLYPPALQRLAREVAGRMKKEPQFPLTVLSRPVGLPVVVDGRTLGKAPLQVSLPAGEYRVELDYGGRRGLPVSVKLVDAPQQVELDRDFEGAVYAEAGPCFEAPSDPARQREALGKLSSRLDATELVTVRVDGTGGERFVVATAVDAARGAELREAKVKLGPAGLARASTDSLADFIATGAVAPPVEEARGDIKKASAAAAERAAAPAPAAGLGKPPPAGGPSGMRVASYALGGAGVLALAGAGYFAWDGHSANQQLTGLLGPDGATYQPGHESEIEALQGRSGRDGPLALGLGIGGAAAVAGAAVLFAISGDAPAAGAGGGLQPAPGGLGYRF